MIISIKLRYTSRCNPVEVQLGVAHILPQTCARHANVNGIEDRIGIGGWAKK